MSNSRDENGGRFISLILFRNHMNRIHTDGNVFPEGGRGCLSARSFCGAKGSIFCGMWLANEGMNQKRIEYLQVCCVCRRSYRHGRWQYKKESSAGQLVSHGYCPVCFKAAMVEVDIFRQNILAAAQ
jgi:hypothetical protein